MKNFLFNNYNIRIDKIYHKDSAIFFYIGNEKIYIVEGDNSKKIEELFKITNEMYNNGILVYTFILNNSGIPYTEKNKKYVVLLKENDRLDDIQLVDFSCYQNYNNNLKLYNLLDVWEEEIDKIEEKIIEYNKEFPLIQNSIDYYIGMGENAIELLYEIKNEIDNISHSIGHKTTYELFNKCKLGDPFTFVRVNRMYDLANYIKYKFYKNEINYDEFEYQLKIISDSEKIYLFANLLYPNIYFDLIKDIMLEKVNESMLNVFINKIKEYELLLSYFKNEFKNVKVIDLINWISD
ncbi:MAG: hypothetical protein IKR57_06415 [Bacilli bacterium]|nr:hypothetical protein [Bacilli bacterium]